MSTGSAPDAAAGTITVDVIEAWPRRHTQRTVVLPAGATVAEAVTASGLGQGGHVGIAIFGERVVATQVLADGDRVELLRGLVIDPKEARRRRAEARKASGRG